MRARDLALVACSRDVKFATLGADRLIERWEEKWRAE
jgi:hypothetical protein